MKPKTPLLFATGQALALNAELLPEWIQLAPYGNHPTRDKKRTQVFNAEAAAQVVQWFDFWPRKVARLMGVNAVPVWVGHPDFDPDTWPDRRQIGNVTTLEARDDGLYGKINWNADAMLALKEEGHKFPSVAWDCDEINATEVQPAFLWSVGMWKKPNIKSVQSVINAGEDFETQDDPTQDDETSTQPTMLNKILEALRAAGILKEGDSEDSVLASIGNMISSLAYSREERNRRALEVAQLRTAINAAAEDPEETVIEGVVTELNAARATLATNLQRIAELEAQVTEVNASRVSEAVSRLIETGRITKADEEAVTTELNADFSAALSKRLAAPLQLNSAALKIGGTKPKVMEKHERMQKLLAWVDQHMTQTNCSYDEAWAASKADNEMKGIHAAMEQTTDADA